MSSLRSRKLKITVGLHYVMGVNLFSQLRCDGPTRPLSYPKMVLGEVIVVFLLYFLHMVLLCVRRYRVADVWKRFYTWLDWQKGNPKIEFLLLEQKSSTSPPLLTNHLSCFDWPVTLPLQSHHLGVEAFGTAFFFIYLITWCIEGRCVNLTMYHTIP